MAPLTRAEKVAVLERCSLRYIVGSLLDAPRTHYIAHQCNCVTTRAAGLAALIFKAYPEANVYTRRKSPSTPGTASLHGGIVNLYAQYEPGEAPVGDSDGVGETYGQRLAWLAASLDDAVEKILAPSNSPGVRIARLALPAGLGCELAGGSWPRYADALRAWADAHPTAELLFYVN